MSVRASAKPPRSAKLVLPTIVILLLLAPPAPAMAHERRQVGPYTFVVGFLTEPAIEGQPNGIDLRITNTETGDPVLDAERTLRAAVAFGGGQAKEFALRSRFGSPGAYATDFIPTRAGSYIFTFTGTISGVPVNARFESGPGRFNDVEAAEKLQFPVQVPAAATLSNTIEETRQRAEAAEDRVGLAMAVGAAGVVVGLIGVAVAGWALATARRAQTLRPA